MSKPLVVYHANCLDGFCSAYIAYRYFDRRYQEAEYLPLDYAQRESIFNHQLKDREVYVIDFSFTPKQTVSIIESCAHLVWLDHHKTAIDDWIEADIPQAELLDAEIILALHNSGCGLAWKHFFPQEHQAPEIIQAIEDRDLWRFYYANTKAICAYMYSIPMEFTSWDEAFAGHEEDPRLTVSYGNILLREQKSALSNALIATAMPCEILGKKGKCANLPPQFASDGGNALARESGTYGATWYMTHRGDVKWSLRSVGHYDVAAIAKQFGGGGHKNAAGFTVSIRTHYHLLHLMAHPEREEQP